MLVGLIVEKIAEVVEIKEENILPPPTIGRIDKGQNKYVYGIGKVGDTVKHSSAYDLPQQRLLAP